MDERKFHLAPGRISNQITLPNVRISIITSRFIRFEWSENGVFEDRQTLSVVNRDLGKVAFKVSKTAAGLVIDTGDVLIELTGDGKKFSAENLKVTFTQRGEKKFWQPGMDDSGNLLGSCRTLDLCDGGEKRCDMDHPESCPGEPVKLCNGLISRDGWSLIDDSTRVVIDKNGSGKWVAPRPAGERQDWYILFYGDDFAAALHDGAEVFGRQPLPPRYTLGYWWSRYWAYSDLEIEELMDGFDHNDIPIDVMVVDMDWHLEGWTGYTWDRRYFPDPDGFLKRLHERGVKITLNLHPADGVGKHEERFEEMARAMGLDPAKTDRVKFDITDPVYMDNYFKILHHPEEKRGVDFWWMDWQQGESTAMKGLDTLPWINQLHWEDMLGRRDRKRPLIFSRFGGIGAGRYAIGFSGDTYSTWASLAYQVYFTATAANVLYGYWSHDIGGHLGVCDPERYVRWTQFGAFSPILRTHTTKTPLGERRPWAFAEPYSLLLAAAIRRRYEMTPYIYSEMAEATRSGISLCRPLYYFDPSDDECYKHDQEYGFGSGMIVNPVVAPVEPESEEIAQKSYLPAGEWYDTVFGCFESGRRTVEKSYRLEEVPVFVRRGAIVPGTFDCRRLNEKCWKNLAVTVYPGESGDYDMYEDDGISTDYRNGGFTFIHMTHRTRGRVRTVGVVHTGKGFDGFEQIRNLEVSLPGCVPPVHVSYNGHRIPRVYRFKDGENTAVWRYDGAECRIVVRMPGVDIDAGAELKFNFGSNDFYSAAAGVAARFRRLKRVATLHNSMGGAVVTDSDERLGQQLSHAAVRISLDPAVFYSEMALIEAKLPGLASEMDKLAAASEKKTAPGFRTKAATKARAIILSCQR
ncbi:MAG: glycoside hydrolase family 31 protein [Victivallaceae bacterium]|nr:glycoside hydrolase family 31 protein [Victivallaceae bacterium]